MHIINPAHRDKVFADLDELIPFFTKKVKALLRGQLDLGIPTGQRGQSKHQHGHGHGHGQSLEAFKYDYIYAFLE